MWQIIKKNKTISYSHKKLTSSNLNSDFILKDIAKTYVEVKSLKNQEVMGSYSKIK